MTNTCEMCGDIRKLKASAFLNIDDEVRDEVIAVSSWEKQTEKLMLVKRDITLGKSIQELMKKCRNS